MVLSHVVLPVWTLRQMPEIHGVRLRYFSVDRQETLQNGYCGCLKMQEVRRGVRLGKFAMYLGGFLHFMSIV